MHKYSTIHYLQNKIKRAAAALPQEFADIPSLERYRLETRRALADMLPVIKPSKNGDNKIVASLPLGDDLLFEAADVCVDEDYYVCVHAYRPVNKAGKLPCVMICPGFSSYKNKQDYVDTAIAFAKAGYVAVVMEYTGTGESASRPDYETDINNVATLAMMLGMSDIGLRVAHNTAALDYLKARDDVDIGRIGITGLCQGGIVLWYTAALCDDFAAVAPVCGVTTLEAEACEYVNRQGGWTGASPFVHNILKVADVGQLLAMLAPRPLLVQNNITDIHWPMSGLQKAMDVTKKAYALYNAEDSAEFLLQHAEHKFYGFIPKLVAWFDAVL